MSARKPLSLGLLALTLLGGCSGDDASTATPPGSLSAEIADLLEEESLTYAEFSTVIEAIQDCSNDNDCYLGQTVGSCTCGDVPVAVEFHDVFDAANELLDCAGAFAECPVIDHPEARCLSGTCTLFTCEEAGTECSATHSNLE